MLRVGVVVEGGVLLRVGVVVEGGVLLQRERWFMHKTPFKLNIGRSFARFGALKHR